MLCQSLKALLGRQELRAAAPPPTITLPPMEPVEPVRALDWCHARLAINDQLWGPGFIFPGGEDETVKLAKPIGISSAGSLLLVGVGSGGPASAVVHNLGAWVTGRESDPHLLTAAQDRVADDRFARKIALSAWDPDNPRFNDRRYNHCLALEPLRRGAPEPILYELAQAVRPGGHLVISGVAANTPLNPDDTTVARWTALDGRNPRFTPTAMGVTRMLGRLGFDVRVVEDVTRRHVEQAMVGWRVLLAQLRENTPDRDTAALMLKEAELWLLKRRLLRDQRLRMMRWHAISRAPARPA
jgi:SAM-dependent methyltransferase